MCRITGLYLLLYLFFCGHFVFAQENRSVVFYNTENLFDTRDDPFTADEEFTPWGGKHWTKARYTDKLRKIAEAVALTGGKELPSFVGLSEVENRRVLEDLCRKTRLADGNYGIVHQDSPDRRGIDVAFLYRKECFTLLEQDFLRLYFPEDTTIRTRDILYVSGILFPDTLHFFVCHFPSMIGGEKQSEWRRERAAAVLREKVEHIWSKNPAAKIVIMGDMNGKADTPAQKLLGCISSDAPVREEKKLYNTGYYLLKKGYGSYRYRGRWQTIDHIIVSGGLLNASSGWKTARRLSVFRPVFLLEKDEAYYGYKPHPTYRGPRYIGGYSDHLPVYLEFIFRP